jgi:hypothetical protein
LLISHTISAAVRVFTSIQEKTPLSGILDSDCSYHFLFSF